MSILRLDVDDHRPEEGPEERPPDPREEEATRALEEFFLAHEEQVFFSRQLEVLHESHWFHWVTNRALRELAARGAIRRETRSLSTGGSLILMWHRRYRYYKREATRVVGLVEEYADPNIGGALGLQGEALALEGFARNQFLLRGRNTRVHG